MSAGSLVGFGIVAVILVTLLSLGAAAIVALGREALTRAGPAAERRAAAWALLAPVGLALTTLVVLALRGSGEVDHCMGHDHHAHLCLVHGAAWLERPWAVALAAAAAITMLMRFAGVAVRHLRVHRAIAEIRRVADEYGDGVRIATSERAFCFVAGWRRPEVFVSSRAWQVLSPAERIAVLAHERAHVAHRDLWIGAVLDVAAVISAPLVGRWLQTRWSDAGERLCDARAAEQTDAGTVASALVALCRPEHWTVVPQNFTPGAATLDRRVRAVLAGGPVGERVARRLALFAAGASVSLIVIVTVFATHLHHALETLLG